MPDREELIVRRDAEAGTVPPGELWYLRTPRFSVPTTCAVVAEFATRDGKSSEVHRMPRSEEFFVVGPHGDDSHLGSYYPTVEAAVEDVLTDGCARTWANCAKNPSYLNEG